MLGVILCFVVSYQIVLCKSNNTGQSRTHLESRYYCNNNIPSNKFAGGCFFFVKMYLNLNKKFLLLENCKKKYHLSTLFGRNNSAIVRAKVLQFICKFYITQK